MAECGAFQEETGFPNNQVNECGAASVSFPQSSVELLRSGLRAILTPPNVLARVPQPPPYHRACKEDHTHTHTRVPWFTCHLWRRGES